jgi:predicted site-specific integrase-resolvase
VIYARVSTKRQADDGLPVESQVAHCREKAAALKADVARVFIDGGLSG